MSRYVIREEDDGSDFAVGMFVFMILSSIVAVILSIFGAFIVVGVVWGTLASIRNYIGAVSDNGSILGETVADAWRRNVESMQFFFDAARDYTHLMPYFVKPFLVMSGVGVIIVGTVLIPFWIVLHLIGMVFVFPFRKTAGNAFSEYSSHEKRPVALPPAQGTEENLPSDTDSALENGSTEPGNPDFIETLCVRAETVLSSAKTGAAKAVAAEVFDAVINSGRTGCSGLGAVEAKISANFSVFSDAVYYQNDMLAKSVGKNLLNLLTERNNIAKLNK